MRGSRGKKREKKERDNEGLRGCRRRHRWEKEKRRNETTSSGSFEPTIPLPPSPMLKGTTRRAEEED